MRKEAAELERRAKEAKDAGRPDEAERLFAESRKVSASADETIGARRDKGGDKGRHDAEAGRKKVQDLRAEAAKLREAGRTEEAARCEEKADAVERWLAGEKPAGAKSADEKAAAEKFAGGKPVGDLSSREAEVRKLESEVEEMRRRVAELEAELERLRHASK
jgi:polyhydroxyalkanoate synthesis regulator phasin